MYARSCATDIAIETDGLSSKCLDPEASGYIPSPNVPRAVFLMQVEKQVALRTSMRKVLEIPLMTGTPPPTFVS